MTLSHVVLYQTNPKNPDAAAQIVKQANYWLKPIVESMPDATFHAAIISPPKEINPNPWDFDNEGFSVILNMTFPNASTRTEYMRHERHKAYVQWVLRGWALTGEDENGKKLVAKILRLEPNERFPDHRRDESVQDKEVVWEKESVIDAES